MKTNINTQALLEKVFQGGMTIKMKFDKRKVEVKEILSVFTVEELKEMEAKRIERYFASVNAPKAFEPTKEAAERIAYYKGAGNYKKNLVVGNSNIYWASPEYGHADYNKAVWGENNARNRRRAELINALINK